MLQYMTIFVLVMGTFVIKHYNSCSASRFLEVDAGDGQPKRQLTIPVKIVRYLPFIQRIQRLYMTEETAKQMTWHKKGV